MFSTHLNSTEPSMECIEYVNYKNRVDVILKDMFLKKELFTSICHKLLYEKKKM
jgi:hypothetical protein